MTRIDPITLAFLIFIGLCFAGQLVAIIHMVRISLKDRNGGGP
jgi:hypothetical protein